MKDKTLEEEIPVTKEALLFYKKGLERELDKLEPVVKRIRLALKKTNEYLSKMTC